MNVPDRIAAKLADRFVGVFAAETVERYVFESYTALALTSLSGARRTSIRSTAASG